MIFKPSFGGGPNQHGVGTGGTDFERYMESSGIKPPQYSSVLDEDGNLPDYLKVKNNYDSTYLDAQKAYVSGGDSPWLKTQQTQIADQGAESIGALGAQNASGLQEAERGLAMRRGLTGGASTRLQELGDEQAMFKRQNINRGMETQNLAATATEAADKQEVRAKIPGMELAKSTYESGIEGSNIANMLAEKERERKAEMDRYGTEMSAWSSYELSQRMKYR